jgi:hypothetical protein
MWERTSIPIGGNSLSTVMDLEYDHREKHKATRGLNKMSRLIKEDSQSQNAHDHGRSVISRDT